MDARSQPPRSSSAPSATVLVVDDDDGIRESLSDLLNGEGYLVFTAPDGLSALDRLRSHPSPLIVLLDWMMPRMDGLAVLRAVAADAAEVADVQAHVFIVLTAAIEKFTQRLRLDGPAIPFYLSVTVLGKPFDVAEVLVLVARAATYIRNRA